MKILSIDDDPGCQKIMLRFMTEIGGHTVETAYTGAEGLKKAGTSCPDLIILDMVLPDMNGLEVMDKLTAAPATSRIPVILLTGASLDEGQRRDLGLKKNFLRLVEKPACMIDLVKSIDLPQAAGRDPLSNTVPGWTL